ncbi:MAG: ABC transporter substrate-binding protein [Anaerolineaceae bacterium]|jgi:branched-chain amino acid transport system substrate-binding protein|nr:MAG: ABC transporter substrate-binding protein [Anaerolineaceae bacterium]
MRQLFHSLTLTAITGILVFGLTACQPGNNQSSPEEIRIGVIAPITGSIPNVGKSTVEAAEMAAAEINENGGLAVGGKQYQIVLLVEDNEDKPETAVAAAEKLINQQNVAAIIGPQASRNAIPVSRIAENSKIPMISPWSTNPETTLEKHYVFRVAFLDPFQGQVMARFIFEELNATKAAVLYDVASPYNSGIAEIFKQVFEGAGGSVTAFETYTTGETDFARQLTEIKDSGAEVLFLPNYENEVPAQAEQARELGINIPIIGSDSWGTIPAESRAALEGSYFSTHYASDIAEEPARTFIQNYIQAYGHVPDDVAALTYDAFGLLFKAIQSQASSDPEAIRTGLAATESYVGVTGTMQYSGSGDPIKSAVILKVVNGEFIFYKLATP